MCCWCLYTFVCMRCTFHLYVAHMQLLVSVARLTMYRVGANIAITY